MRSGGDVFACDMRTRRTVVLSIATTTAIVAGCLEADDPAVEDDESTGDDGSTGPRYAR